VVSRSHQWLVLWAIRKMMADGFVPQGCDGPLPCGGRFNELPRSLRIRGVQPDAWGISASGLIAFAEAKTWEDIDSVHTRHQLERLRSVLESNRDVQWRVYFAGPRSMSREIDALLSRVGLLGTPEVVRLHIPDCLLERASAERS
jgi:hypothetical protein